MSFMFLCIMLPCIWTERNKDLYLLFCIVYIYMYIQMVSVVVYHITYNQSSLIKRFFFSVPMKMIIISERSNCMTKASSVTESYLQNFNHNFFCSSRYTRELSFFTNDYAKRTFDVCDLLYYRIV